MKQDVQVFVFMENCYQRGADGKLDWESGINWHPCAWGAKVADAEDRVFIGMQTVTVEIPDKFNPVPAQVSALNAAKAKALNDYETTVAQINERLSKLLAITNDVAVQS